MIATVAALFIYPVKSMAGIPVQRAYIGLDGILGDRGYAFVRSEQAPRNSFPWMTGRQSARMLLHQPKLANEPTPDAPEPAVSIMTPEGERYDADDPLLAVRLSPNPLLLLKSSRGLFDCQHVSLFSLATVRGLSAEMGEDIDPRRFRANLYFEPTDAEPFIEESWAGMLLGIGAEARIAITQRDSRCMMINLHPATGEQDPRVLKTVAQHHQGQAGLYANVVRPGWIHPGDSLVCL